MRIAMFSSESLHSIAAGGLGVHVTELAAGLERRGHEVHVISRRADGQRRYDRIDGVHYHRVDQEMRDGLVDRMDSMCRAMTDRFREVTSMIGKFDLAHAHDWSTVNAMRNIKGGFGTPSVLTMHSTEYGRAGNVLHDGFARSIRDREAAGCREATVVIAVSRFLAEELSGLYRVASSKINVVHNGVNFRAYDGFIDPGKVKARWGIAPMAPTVLSIGRMTPQKGLDMLIEAVPMVLASYPEARFVIVGQGPEKSHLMRLAHQVGASRSIVFAGSPPRLECVALTRACDIVAVPSRNEPFGIVVLEAWAAGKPVVATVAGGPREFVWDRVNGLLVNADPRGLAHGIGTLLADHDRCREFGVNGRRAVEGMFHWDNVAAFTENVYQSVVQ
ncbi:MAG: glycosyltransferase family 4 protein [Defluviicoccus sp.]